MHIIQPKLTLQIQIRSEATLEASERREKITAEIVARTGITEDMIERLVRGFYAKVRQDAVLGPIFEVRIHDWEPHLQRMCAFWSSVALMSGRYHGSPMTKHLPLPVDADHFDRWLALFEATVREICPPKAEAHFVERARRIAESLELGIAGRHGVLLRSGQRFRQDAMREAG
jgi:hemoglobin